MGRRMGRREEEGSGEGEDREEGEAGGVEKVEMKGQKYTPQGGEEAEGRGGIKGKEQEEKKKEMGGEGAGARAWRSKGRKRTSSQHRLKEGVDARDTE